MVFAEIIKNTIKCIIKLASCDWFQGERGGSTREGNEKCTQENWTEETLRRPRGRWGHNVNMGLKKVICEVWIDSTGSRCGPEAGACGDDD